MAATGLGQVHFRVDSIVLRRQAEEVGRRLAALERLFGEMDTVVRRTHSYWAGQSAQTYRKLFDTQRSTASQILNRLRIYPVELLEIAGNYEKNEMMLEMTSATLGNGVIH
ncbi:MAG: hypothetical protein IJ617_00805 [Oscillospiraceae bacterium]|nr:hypothetical protein [Oscillospiraceae bacterium]